MVDAFRTCRDGHRCENGSQCVEDPEDEGSYLCDCSTAPGDYAGLYCEYEAETYCKFPQEVSQTWFCSNGGTCVVDVSTKKSQYSCDCPKDYVGGHCEYVKGTLPSGWSDGTITRSRSRGSKRKGDGLEAGIKATISVVVLLVVSLIAFFIIQKRRVAENDKMNAPKDQAEALQIDADGEVLQEAVKSLTTPTHEEYDFENGVEVAGPEDEKPRRSHRGGAHGRII